MSSPGSLNKSDSILGMVNLFNFLSKSSFISQSAELTQYSDPKCSCLAISFPRNVEKNGISNMLNEASCRSSHAFRAGRADAIEGL